MPTLRLGPKDKDFAVIGTIPVDAEGITYIYGRQSCDTRSMEGGGIDVGNQKFCGQEAMVILDNVFIPWEHVFMHGEYEFAAMLVERFTCYHRRSYVCKSGVGDVLIGAAAAIADYNGVSKASHIIDKLVQMTHLNETIYATGIASSYQAHPTMSGVYLNDDMLANVCKHRDPRACCAIYDTETRTMQLKRYRYDIEAVVSKVRSAGLPVELGVRLRLGR